ncbi:hypothetical protein AQUCO_00900477v1 [Aquilegia coerulea]|uniref:Uncharacterized protein n=1 Tax=Aquilegia coerulea TaxID=218851 RepID=A0A2G5EDV3_AQUCA|nr:hypothetical protein AQUCO_00900477v1 [Aquilegia coerulea]
MSIYLTGTLRYFLLSFPWLFVLFQRCIAYLQRTGIWVFCPLQLYWTLSHGITNFPVHGSYFYFSLIVFSLRV